jgi:hypothetical protein
MNFLIKFQKNIFDKKLLKSFECRSVSLKRDLKHVFDDMEKDVHNGIIVV